MINCVSLPPPSQTAQDELTARRKSFALSAGNTEVGDVRATAPRTPELSRAWERLEKMALHRSLSADGLHTPLVCVCCVHGFAVHIHSSRVCTHS